MGLAPVVGEILADQPCFPRNGAKAFGGDVVTGNIGPVRLGEAVKRAEEGLPLFRRLLPARYRSVRPSGAPSPVCGMQPKSTSAAETIALSEFLWRAVPSSSGSPFRLRRTVETARAVPARNDMESQMEDSLPSGRAIELGHHLPSGLSAASTAQATFCNAHMTTRDGRMACRCSCGPAGASE